MTTASPTALQGITIHALHEATPEQLQEMAKLNIDTFQGNGGDITAAMGQISDLRRADTLHQYFVAVNGETGAIVGYAGWLSEGGFRRKKPVFQLEQIAIVREFEGQGLALMLAEESCKRVAERERDNNPKHLQFDEGGIGIILATMYVRVSENRTAIQECESFFPDGEKGRRNIFDYPEILVSRNVQVEKRA